MPQGITLTAALLLSVVLVRLLLLITEIMFDTGFASTDIQIDNTPLYLSHDKEVKYKVKYSR